LETIPLQIEGYSFGKLYPSKSRGICGESYPSKSRGILLANYAPPNRGVFYPFPIGVFLWQIVPLQIEGYSFGKLYPSKSRGICGESYPSKSRGILLANFTPPIRGVFMADRTPPNRGCSFSKPHPSKSRGILPLQETRIRIGICVQPPLGSPSTPQPTAHKQAANSGAMRGAKRCPRCEQD